MAYAPQTWVNNDTSKPINDTRLNHMETGISNALDKTDTGTQTLASHIAMAATKKIQLTANDITGSVQRLIEFHSTNAEDRPWASWFDENGRHVAAMGYHTKLSAALGGTVLKQFEIKTIADALSADPTDLRTRLAIQVDKQRITYGHTYTESLEVYQGENPITVGEGAVSSFGLNLRTDPQDTTTAGASNFIIANFLAQIDQNDNAFLFIDVKAPYNTAPGTFVGPLGTIAAGNRGASIVFFRNTNLVSGSNPNIQIKKGDGTNTSAISVVAKSGKLQLLLATAAAGALELGSDSVANLYRSAAGVITSDGSLVATGTTVGSNLSRRAGTPEAAITASKGDVVQDTSNGQLWVKTANASNTGWAPARLSDDYYLNGNQFVRRTIPRHFTGNTTTASITSGVMWSFAVVLYAGDVITNITLRSGSTGLTQGSNNDGHWWFALYDPSLTLMAQTADQTTAAWASGSLKTLALSAQQTVVTTGVHYISVMVNPGTGGAPAVPTLTGLVLSSTSLSDGWAAGQKKLAQSSGSGLTTTAPGTIATPTTQLLVAYSELS